VNDDRLVSVVVVGARGRMGKTLIRTVMQSDNLTLAGAVERSGGPGLGQDAGRLAEMPEAGIIVSDVLEPPRRAVVVDFSLPEATDINIKRCLEHRAPLVLGTTGLSADSRTALKEAATQIPIVAAANFSVGVTLLLGLASIAAAALGPSWESEIVEIHHRHKRDAPSGTALRVGKAVADTLGRKLEEIVKLDRHDTETPRTLEEIGISALRGGDSVGEHTLMMFGEGERLELTHRATNRAIFARGALRAARWVVDREPGLYDMADVLGLTELS
jgi:4-hydroxy-tetrahydrodipicolinate reductase